MKLIKVLTIATLVVCVSSCCSCRKNKSAGVPLIGTKWQTTILDGVNIDAKGESYSLVFGAENNFSGVGDCNRLMGGYTLTKNNGLKVDNNTASTKMMCPDQAMETTFIRTLSSIDSYTIDGQTLMLLSEGNVKIVMVKK